MNQDRPSIGMLALAGGAALLIASRPSPDTFSDALYPWMAARFRSTGATGSIGSIGGPLFAAAGDATAFIASGLARPVFRDFLLFRTATLSFDDQQFTFIGAAGSWIAIN